jgi:hypothetical protein
LTDASIGAHSVGVAMLLVGKLGLQTPQMAVGSLIAISGGLLLALPTALTGLLDWLDIVAERQLGRSQPSICSRC